MLMNIPNGGNFGIDPLIGGGIGIGNGMGFGAGYGRTSLLSTPAPLDAYVGRKAKNETLPILATIGAVIGTVVLACTLKGKNKAANKGVGKFFNNLFKKTPKVNVQGAANVVDDVVTEAVGNKNIKKVSQQALKKRVNARNAARAAKGAV